MATALAVVFSVIVLLLMALLPVWLGAQAVHARNEGRILGAAGLICVGIGVNLLMYATMLCLART